MTKYSNYFLNAVVQTSSSSCGWVHALTWLWYKKLLQELRKSSGRFPGELSACQQVGASCPSPPLSQLSTSAPSLSTDGKYSQPPGLAAPIAEIRRSPPGWGRWKLGRDRGPMSILAGLLYCILVAKNLTSPSVCWIRSKLNIPAKTRRGHRSSGLVRLGESQPQNGRTGSEAAASNFLQSNRNNLITILQRICERLRTPPPRRRELGLAREEATRTPDPPPPPGWQRSRSRIYNHYVNDYQRAWSTPLTPSWTSPLPPRLTRCV